VRVAIGQDPEATVERRPEQRAGLLVPVRPIIPTTSTSEGGLNPNCGGRIGHLGFRNGRTIAFE
jgi:hypothetical protein